ncbi:thymidylate synthase [Frigoribacterium sp. UYMn621]|uniref:thymidylate synthase n=1 Tax=Frigoribacterium sp. UYMn621 TaxID=3156343 RepID=UPI003396E4AE
MTRLQTISTTSIGEAWLQVAELILDGGAPSEYDGLPITELERVVLDVEGPDPTDSVIAKYADPERLQWMRSNFTDRARVAELGNARSYASRFFDYAGVGKDQLEWVTDRLRKDPLSRSATITTFEPLTDTTYIPCVSMLDFWIRNGLLELIVYAHSIDFGAKGYGNLLQLAELQTIVAARLEIPAGPLVFIIKSAHIYERDIAYMTDALNQASRRGPAEHIAPSSDHNDCR